MSELPFWYTRAFENSYPARTRRPQGPCQTELQCDAHHWPLVRMIAIMGEDNEGAWLAQLLDIRSLPAYVGGAA